MSATITITATAAQFIKKMIEKNNGIGFRLSIKKTGCSGFSYAPAVVSEINAQDELVEIDGIKVFVDVTWMHLLQQLAIDYVSEESAGLKQKRLHFSNPNESSRCGCGESFHVE